MPVSRSRLRRHSRRSLNKGVFQAAAEAIWGPPGESCPKCKSETTEYYDPFFFAPLRTLSGKRRIQCNACGFIWRPSRSKRSLLQNFNPQM